MVQQSGKGRAPGQAEGYLTRPGIVTLICLTSLLGIAVQVFGLALYLVGQQRGGGAGLDADVILYLVLLGLYGSIIWGLWRARNWARFVYVILFPFFIVLELAVQPTGFNGLRLVAVVIFSVLLFRPKASAYFRGEILAPIDPTTGLEIGDRQIIQCASCGKEIYSSVATCHHCGAAVTPNNTPGSA